MAENRPDLENRPQPGHEDSDVHAWAVGKFAIALVLLCIFAIVVLLGFFQYLQTRLGPLASASIPLPQQPRLETAPTLDLQAMRDAEDKMLTSYGWVDRQKGVVRIPIAQAIDLLAERGLPSRPQNGVQSASDASVPTESGLGPKAQQVGGPLAGGGK